MKLIIGGSTGFVGAELVQQALSHPSITTVVGISRRETPAPAESSSTTAKLVPVVCDDFENYPDHVKKELEDADACIWTIGVTPTKAKYLEYGETAKVCRDYALAAIRLNCPTSSEYLPTVLGRFLRGETPGKARTITSYL